MSEKTIHYISTRNPSHQVSLSEAILNGIAPDGGLYVPHDLPKLDWSYFLKFIPSNRSLTPSEIAEFSYELLSPFFINDSLFPHLKSICQKAFNFPLPIKFLNSETSVLELFHGPTAAFKDIGARFLAECLLAMDDKNHRTVLAATSGDTGSAVASAFDGKKNISVIILYPKGMVSPGQEKLLTCWSDNVISYSVRGNFDDCQRLVKEALKTPSLQKRYHFISANSINIGRLLPQMIYYALTSLIIQNSGFIIPSGNLGNATAALLAQKLGFPIREIILATNSNTTISSFFKTGEWLPQDTISTLANAMDVGSPSNMERILYLFPSLDDLKKNVRPMMTIDEEIKSTILNGPKDWGEIWCPHTATAVHSRTQLKDNKHWVIVSTAHPAKFGITVESILKEKIHIPPQIEVLLNRPHQIREIDPDLSKIFS